VKIKIEPGHIVRLTARKNSSSRGCEIDLSGDEYSDADRKRILACKGVTAIAPSKAAAKTGEAK
jgi:hypothetical protein